MQLVAKKLLWRREQEDKARGVVADREDAEDYLARLLTAYDEDSQVISYLDGLLRPLAEEHFPQIVPRDRIIASNSMPFAEPGARKPEWRKLVELGRRAEIEHIRRLLDRLSGDHGDKAHDPIFADVMSFGASPASGADDPVSIGTLIGRFLKDPRRSDFTESANKKYVMTFRALQEVVGPDRAVGEVSRKDCAQVQELLAGLPKNLSKLKPYAGLSLKDSAKLCAERDDPRLSLGSVKVYTQTLSAFFNYAIDRGVIEHNPASRMAVSGNRGASVRHPYSLEQVNTILAALPEWSDSGRITGRYWVPLIALFAGMRMGEIVSLRVSEVAEKEPKRWAFQLKHAEDRPLKTKGSERTVPVHAALVELGLIDLVKERRKEGAVLLFPDLKGDDHAERVHAFQRRYEYLQKRKLGIVDAGVSFHSFRHLFRDALRECGVPTDTTRALGGWARSGGVEERYGQGTSFATLSKWMGRVEFPGLDLEPVKRPAN